MKPVMLALFAIIAFALVVAGVAMIDTVSGDSEVPLTIITDRNVYSPAMSVTVGIGLTPGYPATVDNSTVSFRWQTDYGNFLTWNAPDYQVIGHGQDLTTDDGKVYWSYVQKRSDSEEPAHITLTMIDKATGAVINSSRLEIGWGDWNTSLVRH